MSEFSERVYSLVRQIPAGKVATYGHIAVLLGSVGYSRAVGNALHKNSDSDKTPCHRVVKADGRLSEDYAFGGIEGQRKRLVAEGVEVTGNKVDIGLYLW